MNACYVEARRTRRWDANVRLLTPDMVSGSTDALLSVDDRDELERAFRRLPPDQRAVLVLHYYLGMRHAEIAETLDVPVGTVKSRIHYASATLRAAIEADARTTPTASTGERPA